VGEGKITKKKFLENNRKSHKVNDDGFDDGRGSNSGHKKETQG